MTVKANHGHKNELHTMYSNDISCLWICHTVEYRVILHFSDGYYVRKWKSTSVDSVAATFTKTNGNV